MYCNLKIALALLVVLPLFTTFAHAQERKPALVSDPAARVPDVRYQSAFDGYQPYREQKLAPWRELNDEVHKAGGHIGIVGGASGATGKPAAPHPPGHKK